MADAAFDRETDDPRLQPRVPEEPPALTTDDDEAAQRLFDVAPESALDAVVGGGLVERYGVPPFTVLDRRQGYWQERGRQWRALGIKSEIGRTARTLPEDPPPRGASAAEIREWEAENERQAPPDGASRTRGPMSGKGNLHQSIEWEARVRAENRSKSTGAASVATMNHLVPNHLAREASIFDPVLCELAYEWFCPLGGSVLDPFAGGSVRGIVCGALGRSYVGIDLSDEQVRANREQAEEVFAGRDERRGRKIEMPRWIAGDSREVLPRSTQYYDMIFSCPPYGDLEVYSDDPRDISTLVPAAFDEAYAEIIRKALTRLADDSFAAFVVGNYRAGHQLRDLVGITVRAFEDAGAIYYNEVPLIDAVGTAAVRAGVMFRGTRKLARVHQTMVVCCKGDPKAATEKLAEL